MKLTYSEIFGKTVQGEGMFMGVPSVFLRTFGCNFRCKNFGLPKTDEYGRYNPEVKKLLDSGILDRAEKLEDLPIIHTGCDTYASIYPEFKKYMKKKEASELVSELLAQTPEGSWTMSNGQDIHLILTGGEPLLAWQKLYVDLFEQPGMNDLKNLTIETNSTQALYQEFYDYLNSASFTTTFSCSPKLSVSGEAREKAIRPEIVKQYSTVAGANLYLKFVIASRDDVEEVRETVSVYRSSGVECPVYVMPVGGRSEEYNLTMPDVAQIAIENGWRFSPRMHIDLFGNAWGT